MTVNTQKDGTKLTITADGMLGTTSAPLLEKALKENIGDLGIFIVKKEYGRREL